MTELPLPALDQRLFDACLQGEETCWPTDYDRSYCNYMARTMGPERASEYECINSRGCDAAEECLAGSSGSGTLGTSFCERAAECRKPCPEGKEVFLNSIADTLRPQLV